MDYNTLESFICVQSVHYATLSFLGIMGSAKEQVPPLIQTSWGFLETREAALSLDTKSSVQYKLMQTPYIMWAPLLEEHSNSITIFPVAPIQKGGQTKQILHFTEETRGDTQHFICF